MTEAKPSQEIQRSDSEIKNSSGLEYKVEQSGKIIGLIATELAKPRRTVRRAVPPSPQMSLADLIAGQLPVKTMDNPAFTPKQKELFKGNDEMVDRQARFGVLIIDQLALNEPSRIIDLMGDIKNIGIHKLSIHQLIPEITLEEADSYASAENEVLSTLAAQIEARSASTSMQANLAERLVRGKARFYLAAAQKLKEIGGPKLTSEKQQILRNLGIEIK